MDVSVKATGNLARSLKFTVPAAEVEKRVATRLRKMTKTVRLDGFRPGKVPVQVIRERFGQRVFNEVASEVIESSYHQALAEHQLTPAGQPDFKDTSMVPGQDLQFTADIELYPQFEPAPLDKASVEKPVCEVSEGDVDDMIERLRLRYAEWRSVERPARDGDRVRVRFVQKVDLFETDENHELVVVLGAALEPGSVEQDFTTQLLQAAPGERRTIKIKLPRKHPQGGLLGKKLKFVVTLREIHESVLPPVEQAFFEQCGVKEGGLEALRDMLRQGMEYELHNKLKSRFKKNVLDVLIEKNPLEVPPGMVRREIERMRQGMASRFGGDEDSLTKIGDELFKDQAIRHVKLGLIMNKIAERHDVQLSEQEFEAHLDQLARNQEDPAVRQQYRQNPQLRSALFAAALEDRVFKWVVERVHSEEKSYTFKQMMAT